MMYVCVCVCVCVCLYTYKVSHFNLSQLLSSQSEKYRIKNMFRQKVVWLVKDKFYLNTFLCRIMREMISCKKNHIIPFVKNVDKLHYLEKLIFF